MTNPLTITSIGPPPERYAQRMTGEMMHALARKYTVALDEVWRIVLNAATDGGRRAQQKLKERIAQTGTVFSVQLRPGKRGRYRISMTALTGWDPRRDAIIEVGDPVPERPWLAQRLVVIESQGGGREHHTMEAFTRLYALLGEQSRDEPRGAEARITHRERHDLHRWRRNPTRGDEVAGREGRASSLS
jgi:hypothetical protein